MNLFQIILLDMILLMFPLLAYLFYITYSQNIDKKENNLFLDFSIITSFYFVISYGQGFSYGLPLIIFNVPLVIAYNKKRHFSIMLISVAICTYYYNLYNFNLILLALEYLVYYLLFIFKEKKYFKEITFITLFLSLKSVLFSLWIVIFDIFVELNANNVIKIIIYITLFISIVYISLLLFKKGEEILKIHMNLKDLQKEKQIRTSLFKITHEIKNPISVCKGYLDMFDVNNVNHSIKYVPILKEEITRTLALLQDFLSLDSIKIEKDILDINMLLDETLNNFDALLKNNNIVGCFDISEDEVFIYGDYNRLSQVIINMIQNSVEAMDKSKIGYVKVYTILDDDFITVYFEDNGNGISDSDMKKMKEPFFTTKLKGTGLGVFLSNEIVKSHSGTLEYISKVGYGTTVVLKLPIIKD